MLKHKMGTIFIVEKGTKTNNKTLELLIIN